jgi:hypothetical protein
MNNSKLFPFLVIISTLLMNSCKQQKAVKTEMNDKHTLCYTAIDKNDTAWLKLDTSGGQILGELDFQYANKNHYKGIVKALVKGDTLRGYYSFKLNNVDKWYKNPLALLKKNNTLTMGVGEVMTLWGSGYFNKEVPIDYEKGRFVFKQTGCILK